MKHTMIAMMMLALASPLLAQRVPDPVPEPSSIVLMSAGVAGVVLMARRRKGQK